MLIKKYVRNKQTIITSRLARTFLMAKEGDSIPTISDFSQIFGVGSGTVQSAIQLLKLEKAIEVEAKGFLGTYITKLDYKKLWELSEFGVLLGLLPLSTDGEINAIVKKITVPFQEQNIQMHISFMPGSVNRVNTLINEKCDFVVISELAYTEAKKDGQKIEKVTDLGEGTDEAGLLIKSGNSIDLEKEHEVGVHLDSYEYEAIVKKIDKKNKIKIYYKEPEEIIRALIQNEIHWAIVSKSEIHLTGNELEFIPVSSYIKEMLPLMNNVMVVREEDQELRKILAKKIGYKHKKENLESLKPQTVPLYVLLTT